MYDSMLITISAGRSFTFGDFMREDMSAWVVDARRGVGRDVNGIAMF